MPEINLESLLGLSRAFPPALRPAWLEAHSLATGIGIGAVWMFLVAHFHPKWLGLAERTATRNRFERIRTELLRELREIEGQMRVRPDLLRMESEREEEGQQRAA